MFVFCLFFFLHCWCSRLFRFSIVLCGGCHVTMVVFCFIVVSVRPTVWQFLLLCLSLCYPQNWSNPPLLPFVILRSSLYGSFSVLIFSIFEWFLSLFCLLFFLSFHIHILVSLWMAWFSMEGGFYWMFVLTALSFLKWFCSGIPFI